MQTSGPLPAGLQHPEDCANGVKPIPFYQIINYSSANHIITASGCLGSHPTTAGVEEPVSERKEQFLFLQSLQGYLNAEAHLWVSRMPRLYL